MKISINPTFFCPDSLETGTEPLFAMFRRISENGIKQFDFLSDVKRDDYVLHAERCREAVDRSGAVVHQSHCPIWRYRKNVTMDNDILPASLRAVEAAGILGAEFLVVHADENRYENSREYNPEKILSEMYEYISRIVEKASGTGLKICIENLFEEGRFPDMERSRFTSTIDELMSLVSMFPEDRVGVCWDFGHAMCAFGDNTTEMFRIALPRIRCTHVHDNNGKSDQHMLPFTGKNDWKTLISELRESGYSGNLSYEMHCGYVPEPLINPYLEYAKKLGDYLLTL